MELRVVPPTEMTFGEADGYSAGYSAGVPASPDETKWLTPEWRKWLSSALSPLSSAPPQLFETYPAWPAA